MGMALVLYAFFSWSMSAASFVEVRPRYFDKVGKVGQV
jgi:hypothetical protein